MILFRQLRTACPANQIRALAIARGRHVIPLLKQKPTILREMRAHRMGSKHWILFSVR
jgi:hypothetical protein